MAQQGNVDQHVEALLEWKFETEVWYQFGIIPGQGTVKVNLKKDLKKYTDDSSLPNYVLHLDAAVDYYDWQTTAMVGDLVDALTGIEQDDILPLLPRFRLKLINCNFFLLQNLLLPGEKVIAFEATPGARFPLDVYIVGKVAHKSKVTARMALASA